MSDFMAEIRARLASSQNSPTSFGMPPPRRSSTRKPKPTVELEEKKAWIDAVGPIARLRARVADLEAALAALDSAVYNQKRAEAAEARVAELKYDLENLLALVEGECPSLLENDHHWEMVRAALEGKGDE